MLDPFRAKRTLSTEDRDVTYYALSALQEAGLAKISRLPYAIRVLLEALLRTVDGRAVTEDDVRRLARWGEAGNEGAELPFRPSRVVLQDFTGVPCIADLAAMRDALAEAGGDPAKVNPLIPVDLVIDHSVQVDAHGTSGALAENVRREFERNGERYAFLKWGQRAFANLRVVPPATGIVHQVNLELLASVVRVEELGGERVAFPDTVVGTDSHTTMINGLGVLGWGVGGIEAEAAMLGQPVAMTAPPVVGVELSGALREGVTATDLVLAITEILRKHGVVEKFVEFHGSGASALSLADRATVANMAPEYGATVGYFPIDGETLRYLRATGREERHVALVEAYAKAQGLFREDGAPTPSYSERVAIDLARVEPAVAGPKRPQDRVPLSQVKRSFREALIAPTEKRGYGLAHEALTGNDEAAVRHGSVIIAAITSCTNTSNPSVMLAAGLLAKKATERGLRVPDHVKTSLAPGSRAVTAYLEKAGLTAPLEQLGFGVVGYGCTTCIGNSGPVEDAIAERIERDGIVAAAVLSGNRNFEGRVHPSAKANYLASPPLVVAYALAGRVDVDFATEPIGIDSAGKPVTLAELWPSSAEIDEAMRGALTPEVFREQYGRAFEGSAEWQAVKAAGGDRYAWDAASSYIKAPPFFASAPANAPGIAGARALVMLGDSVTTDHISPAGNIAMKSAAAKYLMGLGVVPSDFNSYGARRGNHEVMMRGTFANVRLKNLLAPGTEGGVTTHLPSGDVMSIFDASARYVETGTPLIVIAGKDYGMGSSRDWAAKGVRLLGVKAVLFESVERIHRSNLAGMGILPLQFKPGETPATLGLTGRETFTVAYDAATLAPGQDLRIVARRDDGAETTFVAVCRLDTPVEIDYHRCGGILPYVLRAMSKTGATRVQP